MKSGSFSGLSPDSAALQPGYARKSGGESKDRKMIQIESYSGINGVDFGSREDDFVAAFGEPMRRRVNRMNAQELHYRDFISRFDSKAGLLYEFTLLPECVASINGTRVEWKPAFLRTIQQVDPGLMESFGFVVSYKLGLAFTGFHDDDRSQMAVHAFQRGLWDTDLKDMKPFYFHVS